MRGSSFNTEASPGALRFCAQRIWSNEKITNACHFCTKCFGFNIWTCYVSTRLAVIGDDAATGHGAAGYNGWAAQMGKMLNKEFGSTLSFSHCLDTSLYLRVACAALLCVVTCVESVRIRFLQSCWNGLDTSGGVEGLSKLQQSQPDCLAGSLQEGPWKHASKASSRGKASRLASSPESWQRKPFPYQVVVISFSLELRWLANCPDARMQYRAPLYHWYLLILSSEELKVGLTKQQWLVTAWCRKESQDWDRETIYDNTIKACSVHTKVLGHLMLQ